MIDIKNFAQGVDFGDMEPSFFLIGLISEFESRFQAMGDSYFEAVSFKQAFLLNCVTYFKEPPSIRELSELLGSSHQNTKQLLTKLERGGYVELRQDVADRRKQRIYLTGRAEELQKSFEGPRAEYMGEIFRDVKPKELETTIKVISQLLSSLKRTQEKKK